MALSPELLCQSLVSNVLPKLSMASTLEVQLLVPPQVMGVTMAHVAYRYSLDQLVDLRNCCRSVLYLHFSGIVSRAPAFNSFSECDQMGLSCQQDTSSDISCNLWVVSEPRSRMLAQHGRRKAPHGQLRGLQGGGSSQVSPEFELSMSLVFLESLPVLNLESRYSTYSTSRGNGWSVVPVSPCPGFCLKLWLPYYQSTDQQMSRILPLPSGDKRGPCLRRYWLKLLLHIGPSPSPC